LRWASPSGTGLPRRDEARGEGEIELARRDLPGELSLHHRRGPGAQERAGAEIGIEPGMGEEAASAGRIDADVEEGEG